MTVVVVVAAVAAVMVTGRPRSRHRALAVLPRTPDAPESAVTQTRPPARMIAAGVALVGAIALVPGLLGIVAGAVFAGLIAIAPVRRATPRVLPDEVAIVIDLVAGCLDSGASLPDALDAAGMTSTGLLHDRCVAAARSLRAGATGVEVWQSWLDDPSLAGFARTAVRTSHTGAAAAADFRRTATRVRARHRARAQQRVRQASVWLVVPLGLCFLPAFVLVAVVPIVIGLFPALHV
jgi:Flp pilus assembly protein TadB